MYVKNTVSFFVVYSRMRRPDIEEAPLAASFTAFYRCLFLLFWPKALCPWHLIKAAGEFRVQTLKI